MKPSPNAGYPLPERPVLPIAPKVARIAVLGATGSIGTSALEVIAASEGSLVAAALSAHSQVDQVARLARDFGPSWLVLTDPDAAKSCDVSQLPPQTKLLSGQEAIEQVAREDQIDVVLSAIVGSAGLRGTWAALDAGKTVALANKESLVMAGSLVTDLASRRGARIVPVDSEHSAIFQLLQAGRHGEIRRLVLTASGGPFRQHSREQMADVSVADALAHPTWKMGKKITVDSATMMNKALEIIEARWLFGVSVDQIEVVVHPQSVIHSFVEFVDGSVVAQMSPPDMKLPIQYALTYPRRKPSVATALDWSQPHQFDFEPADFERFPALTLGMEVARAGGTAGAVLNAANETAVEAFLQGRLSFLDIVPICRRAVENHHFDPRASLEELLRLDAWAREEVSHWVGT